CCISDLVGLPRFDGQVWECRELLTFVPSQGRHRNHRNALSVSCLPTIRLVIAIRCQARSPDPGCSSSETFLPYAFDWAIFRGHLTVSEDREGSNPSAQPISSPSV